MVTVFDRAREHDAAREKRDRCKRPILRAQRFGRGHVRNDRIDRFAETPLAHLAFKTEKQRLREGRHRYVRSARFAKNPIDQEREFLWLSGPQ